MGSNPTRSASSLDRGNVFKKNSGGPSYFIYRLIERLGVLLGRFTISTYLTHVLQSGSPRFIAGSGVVHRSQGLDTSTHSPSVDQLRNRLVASNPMEIGRLESFSDGVFAVAITLLAFGLVIPGPGHGPLMSQLGNRWPEFASYVVSFFVIGIAWVNHHTLIRRFKRAERSLLFANLVLLMFVVMIPFATSTMAEYLLANNADAHLAAAFYAAALEGMAIGFVLVFVLALRQSHEDKDDDAHSHGRALLRFAFGLLVYLLAIVVAFISAPASLTLIAVAAVYYVFEHAPVVEAFTH